MENKTPNPFSYIFSGVMFVYLGLVVLFFVGWVVLPIYISTIPPLTLNEAIWSFSIATVIFITLAIDRMITYDRLYGKDKDDERDATKDW